MSLDDWMGKPKKPASKKPRKKPPAKKREEPVATELEPEAEETEEGKAKQSTLGLHVYELKCPNTKCKHKKTVKTPGDLKAHHKLCKKCGGEMKLVKSK